MNTNPIDEYGNNVFWHYFGKQKKGELFIKMDLDGPEIFLTSSGEKIDRSTHFETITPSQLDFVREQIGNEITKRKINTLFEKMATFSGSYIAHDTNRVWACGGSLAVCKNRLSFWFRKMGGNAEIEKNISYTKCTTNAYFYANEFGDEEIENLSLVGDILVHKTDWEAQRELADLVNNGINDKKE